MMWLWVWVWVVGPVARPAAPLRARVSATVIEEGHLQHLAAPRVEGQRPLRQAGLVQGQSGRHRAASARKRFGFHASLVGPDPDLGRTTASLGRGDSSGSPAPAPVTVTASDGMDTTAYVIWRIPRPRRHHKYRSPQPER